MLDQNTTTIITSALTVIGTLGGVVLGVVLSNRYVAQQEKAKRNAAIIEEVYILLTNIHSEITQNIEFNNPTLQGKQLQDDMSRVQALVYLYLPSLREKFDIFMKGLFRLSNEVEVRPKNMSVPELWKNLGAPYKEYQAKLNDVKSALEKLVR
jgi:hypothetical protein